MRDVLLVAFMAVAIPLMAWRPPLGAIGWVWFGIMNPHRLAWGFAMTIPFAWLIGLATVIGALFSREPKRLKGGVATAVLLLFIVYFTMTTFFALVPDRAWPALDRAIKVQIGTFLTLVLLYKREHVIWLIWVVAGSIGFYAIKGGLFTLATLGSYRIYGPEDSFIADNNAFALATVMSMPLWVYLITQYPGKRLLRLTLIGILMLSAVSAFGSHSRGALVAIIAMGSFLWLKSRQKLIVGALLVIGTVFALAFMPTEWEERMATITKPREEQSANSRLETWTMLWNMAVDRPVIGGGFEAYQRWIFQKYNPSYDATHAAHSIYFQVLGEHGFIALALFLLFWALVWRICGQIVRESFGKPELHWAHWLGQMLKVSIVAYLVGGAFLNLAYWDMPYYLFVAAAVTRWAIRNPLPQAVSKVAAEERRQSTEATPAIERSA